MKILLTGANGFVGRASSAAAPVICAPSLRGAEKEDIDRLIDTVQPDAILHTAAISDIGACAKDGRARTTQTFWCRYLAKPQTVAKLVLFSSDQVYSGAKGDKPFTEDDVATANLYAEEVGNGKPRSRDRPERRHAACDVDGLTCPCLACRTAATSSRCS